MADDPPAIPQHVLEQMARSEHGAYRLAAAIHPDTPPDALSSIVDMENAAPDREYLLTGRVSLAVARRRDLPAAVAHRLIGEWGPQVRMAAARNGHFTGHELAALAGLDDDATVIGVAGNPRTPAGVLELLGAQDDDPDVQRAVAGNPNTPPHVLDRLARTGHDADLVVAAARNPNMSADTLRWLANTANGSKPLLRAIAGNPSSPRDVAADAAFAGQLAAGGCQRPLSSSTGTRHEGSAVPFGRNVTPSASRR